MSMLCEMGVPGLGFRLSAVWGLPSVFLAASPRILYCNSYMMIMLLPLIYYTITTE